MAELIMLRLEGPLQSWGELSKWDSRESSDMPTRSGIVGLLASALGYPRADERIPALSEGILIGVRADRMGSKGTDFQTVQGFPLLNAEGKRRPGNTIVSPREYLQDASFLVVVQAESAWLDLLSDALKSPVWTAFLGRKSCVPSVPVYIGRFADYSDISDALRRFPAPERHDEDRLCEVEFSMENAASFVRSDIPTGNRAFEKRSVWRFVLKEENHDSD